MFPTEWNATHDRGEEKVDDKFPYWIGWGSWVEKSGCTPDLKPLEDFFWGLIKAQVYFWKPGTQMQWGNTSQIIRVGGNVAWLLCACCNFALHIAHSTLLMKDNTKYMQHHWLHHVLKCNTRKPFITYSHLCCQNSWPLCSLSFCLLKIEVPNYKSWDQIRSGTRCIRQILW